MTDYDNNTKAYKRPLTVRVRHYGLWTFIVLLMVGLVMPDDIYGARRRKRRTSSGKANWAMTAADVNPDSKSPAMKKRPSKRQIVVERPDIEAIRVAVLDPQNKMYFPKLMKKFNQNDTTMTADEYRHLYLGYMFQEDYDPYRESPYSSVTDSYRNKSTHTKEEIDTIRKYAELTLMDNPFDLRQMSLLVHVLKERRKDMSAKIWEYRLEHLLEP